jgi:hypothetical protein
MDIMPTRSVSFVPTHRYTPSLKHSFYSGKSSKKSSKKSRGHRFVRNDKIPDLEYPIENSLNKLDSTTLGKVRPVKAKVVKKKKLPISNFEVDKMLHNTAQRIN